MHTIIVFLPITVLIFLALKTRNMAQSMTAAVILALALLYKGDILSGTIDSLYEALSNSSFQFCLIMMVLFGGMIELFQKSGALQGFGNMISRFASGKKKIMILAWIMAVIMFVDEYLNSITVTFSMRDLTDKNGVPREHLAFQAHAMACCLCAAIPFTSWTGFSLSLISDYGMGFSEYVKAIPFMFYPVLMILCCVLLDIGLVPKVGYIKRAYRRVENGGPALLEEKSETLIDMSDSSDVKPSSALNAVIPLVVLIAGVLIFDNDLAAGLILAIICQFIMYISQKIMSVPEFFENFFNGAKGMTTIEIIVFMGFVLSKANENLGFFDVIIGGVGDALPPYLLPVIAFILVGLCVFAVGGCWVVMLITMPVFVPLAIACGASVPLTVAAVMSGVCMGFSLCFYADTVFLCTAGTGVSNITIIKSTIPYAAVIAAVSAIGFVVLGFTL